MFCIYPTTAAEINLLCHGRTSLSFTYYPCDDEKCKKKVMPKTDKAEQCVEKSVVNWVGPTRLGKGELIASPRMCSLSLCLALTKIHCHTNPESNWGVCFNNVYINVYLRLTWVYYSRFTLSSPLINDSCCGLHLSLLSTITQTQKAANTLSVEHAHSEVKKRISLTLADYL